MNQEKAKFSLLSKNTSLKEQVNMKIVDGIYYFSLTDGSQNRLSLKNWVFSRETEQMLLEINFETENESYIYLKQEHLTYNISVIVKNKKATEKKIAIVYLLNGEEYFLEIELEGEKI